MDKAKIIIIYPFPVSSGAAEEMSEQIGYQWIPKKNY